MNDEIIQLKARLELAEARLNMHMTLCGAIASYRDKLVRMVDPMTIALWWLKKGDCWCAPVAGTHTDACYFAQGAMRLPVQAHSDQQPFQNTIEGGLEDVMARVRSGRL